jgi:hypothetical protein
MTRQELLDMLTVERFALTVRRAERTSHMPRVGSDPDASQHVDDLLTALSTDESTAETQPESTGFRRRPQRPVDGGLSLVRDSIVNGHQERQRKGA